MIATTSSRTTVIPLERQVRKFLRTPKGLLLAVFLPFTCLAVLTTGQHSVGPVLVATATAAIVDMAIVWGNEDVWIFPSGALLTGLLVAFVLTPQEPWYVVAITAGIAISTKRLLRTRFANIFNPAALALVISAVAFSSGQSWWGGLTSLGPVGIGILVAAGVVVASYINKLPLVLSFLASYFVLLTAASIFGSPAQAAEVFRAPDVNAALFFAFFMLDDPPTCPVRYSHQVAFGVIVAVASCLLFLAFGSVYYLLAGLLVGNGWEALRRWLQARARSSSRSIGPRPVDTRWARPTGRMESDVAS
jgi:enediyne biosynthesis protein E5